MAALLFSLPTHLSFCVCLLEAFPLCFEPKHINHPFVFSLSVYKPHSHWVPPTRTHTPTHTHTHTHTHIHTYAHHTDGGRGRDGETKGGERVSKMEKQTHTER